jgi:hypothetical protein
MLYFFYIGCVLPEVMVLKLVQWNIKTVNSNKTIIYGKV